jgi:Cdc6-like AAA superfamily ATPase
MENYTTFLGRETIYNNIREFLASFQKNKSDLTFKRGIYIYGAPGSGKTEFVVRLLKELNYDINNLFTNEEKDIYGMRKILNLRNEVEIENEL